MQSMIQSLHHYQLIFQLEILLHLMLLSMSLLVFLMIELEFCCGDTISKRLWQKKSKFIENKSLDKRSMAATKMWIIKVVEGLPKLLRVFREGLA